MAFAPLLKLARAWLDAPDPSQIDAIVTKGRDARDRVPEERRADWEKLIAAIARTGEADDPARTRAQMEGLVRACLLFRPKRAKREVRPATLDALDPVDRLPGLGGAARAALAEHGLRTVADLVWLPPASWDDLRAPSTLADALTAARSVNEASGGALRSPRIAVRAVVKTAGVVPIRGRRCVRIIVEDEADPACKMHAFWFFLAHGVLALATPGTALLLVGRIDAPARKPARMAHPEIFADDDAARTVRARYGRLGPPEATLRKAIAHAVDQGIAPDPVPAFVVTREGLPDVHDVLREVHTRPRPEGEEVEAAAPAPPPSDRARLAFLERLAWAEAFTRTWERLAAGAREGRTAAPVLPRAPDVVTRLARELGFTFTDGQREAIATIAADLEAETPMRRLLLGDVGTGKTAVALCAAAQAVAAGRQVAVLAPTSVLAEQYVEAVKPLERATGVRAAFIAAGMPAPARRAAEADLARGRARVAIGTHALLQEGLEIPELALVIVDEQQRLGVAQRLSLVKKGVRPHLLSLSATPIPRTLALALRGELATTTLRQRPKDRPAPATVLAPNTDLEAVVAQVAAACARGERVFWVTPRVEVDPDDDESDGLATVTLRHETLQRSLPSHRVVMLHGGLRPAEKRDVMQRFRAGEADVLVGTTVVEVGVDVPEATLMVVENAEQFGMAQLHQLRGRVGRGERPGTCLLLHDVPLEGPARARLTAMTELASGEDVARADLALRGAGDLGGTRQHGVEDELLFLRPGDAHRWLPRVDEDARALHATDPRLERPEHRVLAAFVARMSHMLSVREEAG